MTKTGLLITNLGSPEAPTASALRRYLAEFLWDRRIVDLPRPFWWLILHGIILRTRPRRSANLYKKIWTPEGAPLLVISQRQRNKLDALLRGSGNGVITALGMRYGSPSIAEALRELRDKGIDRLIVLPLYPQNSCSTTGSTFDAVAKELERWRLVPELHFISDYHDHPLYIEALANSIRESWASGRPPQKLLFSFHGTPERFREEGDVYAEHCRTTARLTAERLGLADSRWQVVFQSRFGREEWLKPYADKVTERLARAGVASVDVVCPGFASDCLETLEEMGQENRHLFVAAGGRTYRYIPALNDRDDHMQLLLELATAACP
jgi:ferrochelatase